MTKTILVTGAGSGLGKGTAIGLAKDGYHIIATVHVASQVTPLREEAKAIGLTNFRVERLDLTDPYDVAHAQTFDVDVLWKALIVANGFIEAQVEELRASVSAGYSRGRFGVSRDRKDWYD